MSVIIEQTFPLGRFHATRWKQNPFEDRLGEWPPSPWRLLRALAARWFQYQRETGDDNTSLRDGLLCALAGELPSFRLPVETWRGRGLRQYQPTQVRFTKKKNVPEVKLPVPTLALDEYHALPSAAPMYWIWRTCMLSPEAIQLLRQLLRRIHYFGRAEAWTTMRLVEADGIKPNCELRPTASSASVPVLAHRPDQTLDIAILLANTGDERLSSRRVPPGTTWFQAEIPPCPRRSASPVVVPRNPRVQVVRYALDSTVLPLVTETLPVAEAARRALMSWHGWLTEKNGVRGRSDVLSGKDEHGQRLAGHRHAYYLPTDEDSDGRLDHLTVYAAGGFGHDEQTALDRLRELRTGREGEERHPLRVLLLGMGASDEYRPGPLQESKVWVSVTPYIATRYAKTRGRNRIDLASPEARAAFLREDLRAQLASVRSDLVEEGNMHVEIGPLWDNNHVFNVAGRWRAIQFKRFRRRAGDDGGRRLAGTFRLTFDQRVRGPLVLGWSGHFGLGLFVAEEERE
ncbi:MAG: type I-U CRISPR-associated protein Csb2 [Candidatus Binatia bacterium]